MRVLAGALSVAILAVPAPAREDDEAIRALVEAAERSPDDADAQEALGMALGAAGRMEDAIPPLERAVRIGPASRERLLALGKAYYAVSRVVDAETAFERVLETHPDDPGALHALGNIAVLRGRMEDGVALYRKALASNDTIPLIHYHLGRALRFLGRNEEAAAAFQKAIDLGAEPAKRIDALYQLAVIDLDLGNPERAEARLREVVRADPEHPSAHYVRAQALLKLGKTEEARRSMERHTEVQKRRPQSGPVATSR